MSAHLGNKERGQRRTRRNLSPRSVRVTQASSHTRDVDDLFSFARAKERQDGLRDPDDTEEIGAKDLFQLGGVTVGGKRTRVSCEDEEKAVVDG